MIKFQGALAGVRLLASRRQTGSAEGVARHPDLLFTHLQGVEIYLTRSTRILAGLLGGWFILPCPMTAKGSSFILSFFDMVCLTDDHCAELLTHLACDLILDVGIQTVFKTSCTAAHTASEYRRCSVISMCCKSK